MEFTEWIMDGWFNLLRRKVRSFLAVTGVAVGVFAFVLMGSMAEHFNHLATSFYEVFANKVLVCEKITFWAGGGYYRKRRWEKW